jgi:hypothetical protein
MKHNQGWQHEEGLSGQDIAKRICPFVLDPLEDCFCFEMNSVNVESMIHYCGEKFEECEIYRKKRGKYSVGA